MNYFIISQDRRIESYIEPTGILSVIDKDMLKEENLYELDDLPITVNIKKDNNSQYIDLIDNPVYLISDKLQKLLKKYDENIFFKPVVFTNLEEMSQVLYWLIAPETLNCISSKSEFNKNGTIKKLVINKKKAFPYKIFKVDNIIEDFIVVTLDVAESILRRDFAGINFKKVEGDE